MSDNRLYALLGGRKAAFGLLAAVLLTAMALVLRADYGVYAAALLGALGLTQASVAYEDAQRAKGGEA